mmetsp:Transcript_38992/g.81850  ORF Transcript_38992/g.81850 Transcript_38992/m.81850 type:complete len:264 (-) Transcript_38992:408-1199(-)
MSSTSSLLAGVEYARSKMQEHITEVKVAQAAEKAREQQEAELRTLGPAPWDTLSEQFSILELELKQRILSLSHREELFSREIARQRLRPASVLPGCLPMANAAMAGDPQLGKLRFQLVPQRLTEEEFWRCYFWHVANVKLELCNDFVTANRVRRDAALAAQPTVVKAGTPASGSEVTESAQVSIDSSQEAAAEARQEGSARAAGSAEADQAQGASHADDANFAAATEMKTASAALDLQDFPFDLAALDAEFEALVGSPRAAES